MKGSFRRLSRLLVALMTGSGPVSILANVSGEMKPVAAIGAATVGAGAMVAGKIIVGGAAKGVAEKAAVNLGGKAVLGSAEQAALATASKGVGGATAKATVAKAVVGGAAAREGTIAAAHAEARNAITEASSEIIGKNYSSLSQQDMKFINNRYGNIGEKIKDAHSFAEFADANNTFIDDLSIDMYSKYPAAFGPRFNKTQVASHFTASFGDVIHAGITSRNSYVANQLYRELVDELAKRGISIQDLAKNSGDVSKLVDRIVKDSTKTKTDYKWGYKSGAIYVKGEIGHFSFEQEVSLSTLAKVAASGGAAAAAYKIDWKKDAFIQIHSCIGDFCLDADTSKPANQSKPN
jgi:hypothetical protein